MDVRSVVVTIVSVTIGVILLGSLLIPQTESVLSGLTASQMDEYGGLIKLTVVITIIGIVAAALYMYTSK